MPSFRFLIEVGSWLEICELAVEFHHCAPLPPINEVAPLSQEGTNHSLNKVDGQWHQIDVQVNPLAMSQRLFPRHVKLTRTDGPLSKLLNELEVSTVVRLDVVKNTQMVLNMPRPLKSLM